GEHRGAHPRRVLQSAAHERVEPVLVPGGGRAGRGRVDGADATPGDARGRVYDGAGHASLPRRGQSRQTVATAYVTPIATSSAASESTVTSTSTSARLVRTSEPT